MTRTTETPATRPRPAVRWKAVLSLALAAGFGLVAMSWPLLASPGGALTETTSGPWLFALLLPLVTAVVLLQLTDGGLDARAVAMLGVLSAVVAAVRPFGAGAAGVETVFFLLILAGRVFGPGFGFILGCTGLFASALLTGGVGPWLPYQMFAAAFVALGAGLLPGTPETRAGRTTELAILAVYAAFASLLYGLLLNLSFWPFAITHGNLAYVPGGGFSENLSRLLAYSLATSLGWDIGRAITTVVLVLLTGPLLLRVMRRTARKANWA
ncbi:MULTISPECIES: ECF transporter S component [Glycomyces]|uniref:ECF transporter S component n=1 Tax=Glycomyces lechevalierae TaxID=256034 RepID=A0A9X3PJ32_9ACTN|nr:ECF transporter S component [Glycomyces lechevalierae]MDA1386334.1 ECF transporter S component [Glycomyces lechevalierae]MDR7338849.1 energy-coupling factor transport system substrate-specific component [Glycomyces lechevalierae]